MTDTLDTMGPIDALVDRVTAAALGIERDGEHSERELIRRAVAQELRAAIYAYDTVLAWACGEMSEGRVCELLKIDRLTLRALRLASIARAIGLHGADMETPGIVHKRGRALARINAWIDEHVADGGCSNEQKSAILQFWARAVDSPDFLARFEDWRALCPPAQPMDLTMDKLST